MRLIDADLLTEEIESLRCTLTGLRAGKGVLARAADEYRKSILQIISDQPTAFDKEKVIDELKSAENYLYVNGIRITNFKFIHTLTAIEIVEKGRIE